MAQEESDDQRWERELEPPECVNQPEAVEVLRLWVSGEEHAVSLRSGLVDDPLWWGAMLGVLAQWITMMLIGDEHDNAGPVLERVVRGFRLRLENPEVRDVTLLDDGSDIEDLGNDGSEDDPSDGVSGRDEP